MYRDLGVLDGACVVKWNNHALARCHDVFRYRGRSRACAPALAVYLLQLRPESRRVIAKDKGQHLHILHLYTWAPGHKESISISISRAPVHLEFTSMRE